jgi:hypothetical protein
VLRRVMKRQWTSGTDSFWSSVQTFAWSEPGCTEPSRFDSIQCTPSFKDRCSACKSWVTWQKTEISQRASHTANTFCYLRPISKHF